jgi:hypothetical protein
VPTKANIKIYAIDRRFENSSIWQLDVKRSFRVYLSVSIRPGGEIGRHKGFKIPRPLPAVPVQVRPRAPWQRQDHLIIPVCYRTFNVLNTRTSNNASHFAKRFKAVNICVHRVLFTKDA